MRIGNATAIFCNIKNPEISNGEKIEAIYEIVNLETHNGYKKDLFIDALRWLMETYQFPEEGSSESG